MTIGQRIVQLRVYIGLTQSSLAREAGIPLSTLNYLERGVRQGENLSVATAIRLAHALGVSMDALCLVGAEHPDDTAATREA